MQVNEKGQSEYFRKRMKICLIHLGLSMFERVMKMNVSSAVTGLDKIMY